MTTRIARINTEVVLALVLALLFVGCAKVKPQKRASIGPRLPPAPAGLKATSAPPTRITRPLRTAPFYVPSDFAVSGISVKGRTNVVLTWINGAPPFQPQVKTNVAGEWMDYGASTMLRTITNAAPMSAVAFFRLRGGAATPGLFQWSQTATVNGQASPTKVATDAAGNVVAIGTYQNAPNFGSGSLPYAGGKDGFVAKYNAQGALIWNRGFGSAGDEDAQGLATDGSGNIYVSGSFTRNVDFGGVILTATPSPFGNFIPDIFVVKYGPSGTLLWIKQFGGNGSDFGHALRVGGAGVFVATQINSTNAVFGTNVFVNPSGSLMVLTRLATSDGAVQWAKAWSVGTVGTVSVGLDGPSDMIAAGTFTGTANLGGTPKTSAGNYDVFLAKYSGADGHHLWSQSFGGAGVDWCFGADADPASGHVFITGQYSAGTVNFGGPINDFFGNLNTVGGAYVAAYNSLGNYLWARTPNTAEIREEAGQGVCVDALGNVYFTGKVTAAVNFCGQWLSGARAFFLASLTPNGDCRWAKRSTGASGLGQALATDASAVAVVGPVSNGTLFYDQTLGQAGGTAVTTFGSTAAPWTAKFAK